MNVALPPGRVRTRGLPLSELQAVRIRLSFLIMLVDCLAIVGGCLLGNSLRFGNPFADPGIALFEMVLPLYVGIAINSDAYATDVLGDAQTGLSRAALAYVFAVLAVAFLSFYLKVNNELSRLITGVATVATLACLAAGRYLSRLYVGWRTGGRLVYDLLIRDGVDFAAPSGMQVLDAEGDDLRPDLHDPLMLDRLAKHLRGVDRVVIACPPERRHLWAMLLKGSSVNGFIIAEEMDALAPIGIGTVAGRPTLAVACAPLDLGRRVAKRGLDLALTVPGLLFLAPLLVVTAIAIKLDSGGPIFFLQPRVGQGNRIFLTYKFRSMKADRLDAAGNRSTSKDDDRVTRVGRFIRSSSIDELPQLLNVLRGEMSLVGPRPHALGSLAGTELFWEVDERYWHRHALKPGLTGLAQVRGYRGETREREDLANRLRADLEYLAGWTIWRDVSILASTIRVLVHKNAY